MKRKRFFVWAIAGATLAFQVFSFSSNYHSLMMILNRVEWAMPVAFGVVAIDFAGVKFLLGGLRSAFDDEPGTNWAYLSLGFCWLLTVFGDTWLTYFSIASQMVFKANHILVTGGVLDARQVTFWVPVGFALFVLFIQILLAVRSESAFDQIFEGAV